MPELDPEVLRFYSERSIEPERLRHGRGQLEFARTKDILRRVLPPPPARILDVDPELVAGAARCAAAVEAEPALLGATSHFLAIGRRS